MKKLSKLIVGIIVVLLILVMLAPLVISKDMVKEAVIAQISEQTGQKLTIGGDIGLYFFPNAEVALENVQLGETGKDGVGPLATLKSLEIGLELLPLLSKEIVITKVELVDPVINLHVNAEGVENWQFGSKKATASESAAKKENSEDAELSPADIRLDNIRLTNGSIRYQNDQEKKRWELKQIEATAKIAGKNDAITLKGSAEWNQKEIELRAEVDTLASFLAKEETEIEASISSDLFSVELNGKHQNMEYVGKADIKAESLAAVQKWLNPAAESSFASPLDFRASGQMRCSTAMCGFTKLALSLDDIKATGKLNLEMGGQRPMLNLELDTEMLDLTPFLPAPKKEAGVLTLVREANAATPSGWSREPMDFSALNALNATVNIKTKELRAQKITIGNAIFRAKLHNGRLAADVLNAQLYGGKGDFTFSYDTAAALLEKRIELSGINMEPFLTDAMEFDRMSGTGNMTVVIGGRGKSQYDIVSSLQGSGKLKVSDGAIKGVNIAQMIRNVQSAFKEVDSGSQKTDFAELAGTFTVNNGIVSNSDLAMKAPLMRLSGAGQVNLPERTVNYRLKPEIVETSQGQGGKDKSGIGVPVIVTGTFDKLHFAPDLSSVAKEAIENPEKIKETVKDIKEQFKGDNRKETLRNLRGILKGN